LGWQYVINKNYYSNFSLGGGIPFPKDGFPIMINLEIGLML